MSAPCRASRPRRRVDGCAPGFRHGRPAELDGDDAEQAGGCEVELDLAPEFLREATLYQPRADPPRVGGVTGGPLFSANSISRCGAPAIRTILQRTKRRPSGTDGAP